MSKYSNRIVKKITSLIESDDFTIPEICRQVGIVESTYFKWQKEKIDFSESIKKAQEKRLELFRQSARSGLLTLLKGTEYEEVTTEFIEGKPDKDGNTKPKIKLQRKVKKFILPNPTSVIFALKNLDGENFKDIYNTDITSGGKEFKVTLNL